MTWCDDCVNSRVVISEGGIRFVCMLSVKAAMDCISGKKDHFMVLSYLVNKEERKETLHEAQSNN